jgi:hypothetical protein
LSIVDLVDELRRSIFGVLGFPLLEDLEVLVEFY